MKLQAATICIHYADYLECVIGNRRHFERWIVMTVPMDTATHALCEKHGIECHDSALLQPDGKDFHAVYNKGAVINEGIERLLEMEKDDAAWCVILDADVLLPRHFGERVRAMPLEAGALYGTAGRKVCETREQFEMLKECEPWDRLVARNSQALGYFNLFSLAAAPNRYPIRTTESMAQHDDYLFTTSFAPGKRRMLPFSALHLGKYGVNWASRVSGQYEKRERDAALNAGRVKPDFAADQREGVAAVLGYYPEGRWQDVTLGFSRVILTDELRIHALGGDPMVEADRKVLRRIFEKQDFERKGVEFLGSHTVENVAKIPDGSLSLL